MISHRRSSRNNQRLTRTNQGLTAKQFRAKKLARQPTARLAVVRPGGKFVNVTVRGRDIEKVLLRNEAISDAARGDETKLRSFNRRFKNFGVTDLDTNSRVDLIMSPEALRRSKDQMTKATRGALDKRYSEDMSEAA
jgi:hypothetical protein